MTTSNDPDSPRDARRADRPTHLRSLWNFVLRNRWFTFGLPLLTITATYFFVQNVAPTYQASTWLRVEERESGLPVLEALRTISQGSQIETEMEVLRRRPLAEQVVDSLALQFILADPAEVPRGELFEAIAIFPDTAEAGYRLVLRDDGRFDILDAETEETVATAAIGEVVRLPGVGFRLRPAAAEQEEIRIVVSRFNDAVRRLRTTVRVTRPNRDADVMAIFYEHNDAELVRAVPNTLADAFIEYRQDVRTAEARSTVEFLNEQIARVAGQLRAAEAEMRDFREDANLVDLKVEASTQLGRLATLQAERDQLEAEREALAALLVEVRAAADTAAATARSPYRDLIAFPTLLENFAVSELFRSLAEVENERAALLNRRTPADPDVQVLTSRVTELEDQLRNIALTYLEGLGNQVNSLEGTLSAFQGELSQVPAKEIAFLRLEREATVLEEIYTLLQTRLQEAEVAAAVEDARIRVVEPAIRPLDPIKPNKPLSMILALVLGTVLGASAAFARENMDSALRTRDELRELTDDSPVLGLIPRIPQAMANELRRTLGIAGRGAFRERLVAGRDPRNPVSEAYRSLRTNITFARPERTPESLVFTSPTPGDGKSTTAANLAITLAQQGLRCLLVDADMRRGLLHEVFGAPREPGLSNVILNRRTFEDAVQRIDLDESGEIDFLPSGTFPPNPAELLGSKAMHGLLEKLEAEYDAVLLDAPPLNLVTDAAVLGTYADGVILVARSGVTERVAVAYAMEQIQAVRAPLLGTVLNDIDVKRNRYYGSYGTGGHADYYGSQG